MTIFSESSSQFDLVLVDVEGDGRIPQAEELCQHVKELAKGQKVAFVCNYRVAAESDCPDEVIRSDFDPAALIKGVQEVLAYSPN